MPRSIGHATVKTRDGLPAQGDALGQVVASRCGSRGGDPEIGRTFRGPTRDSWDIPRSFGARFLAEPRLLRLMGCLVASGIAVTSCALFQRTDRCSAYIQSQPDHQKRYWGCAEGRGEAAETLAWGNLNAGTMFIVTEKKWQEEFEATTGRHLNVQDRRVFEETVRTVHRLPAVQRHRPCPTPPTDDYTVVSVCIAEVAGLAAHRQFRLHSNFASEAQDAILRGFLEQHVVDALGLAHVNEFVLGVPPPPFTLALRCDHSERCGKALEWDPGQLKGFRPPWYAEFSGTVELRHQSGRSSSPWRLGRRDGLSLMAWGNGPEQAQRALGRAIAASLGANNEALSKLHAFIQGQLLGERFDGEECGRCTPLRAPRAIAKSITEPIGIGSGTCGVRNFKHLREHWDVNLSRVDIDYGLCDRPARAPGQAGGLPRHEVQEGRK